jgi:hypothetical protein
MPPKKFLKPKPKGKVKPQGPQSENDFLDAADEFEQAAGKWRAGDAAKATRFFKRAIDTYDEGLKHHPQSFDLAYNKYVRLSRQAALSANDVQSKPSVQHHRR